MPYQHKVNKGSLFKNDRREKETHADYRGDINIEGEMYWIDAWVNEGTKGKFLGLSIRKKEGRSRSESPREESPQADFDDQIPF